MENPNPLKKKKSQIKHLKKIITISFAVSIFLVLYWLHSTGLESTITKTLNPIFNMVNFVFNQTFLTLPLKWIPLALVIFLIGLAALILLLWPYILIGASFIALIIKTLLNKRKKRKRVVKVIWICFFVYMITLWFAMANNTVNWLPGKSQAEHVLYKKCNPWAERYTPEAAKKAAGTQIAKYIEMKYGLDITLDTVRKQDNLWKWVKIMWGGVRSFFVKGLF